MGIFRKLEKFTKEIQNNEIVEGIKDASKPMSKKERKKFENDYGF